MTDQSITEDHTDLVEPDHEDVKCSSTRTVEMGDLDTTVHLSCNLSEIRHVVVGCHLAARTYGDVTFTAHWNGDYE